MCEFKGSKVTIMSCSDCNIKCKHCYVSYKGNFADNELYDLCEKLSKKYLLNINGTEVLMQNGYLESINLIRQFRVLTNGLVLTTKPNILEEIKKTSINMIAMSYHFGIHNDVSSVKEETLKKNIKIIQDAGLNVELMCTITKENFNKIEEICEEVLKLGVHKIRFVNYLKTGNAMSIEKDYILSEDEKKIFFRLLKKARKKYPKEQLLIKRCGTFGNDNENPKCNFKCSAGYEEVVIAPDKKVYPCIFLVKPEYIIGEYKDAKVIINKDINHNRKKCLASDIYNFNCEFKI